MLSRVVGALVAASALSGTFAVPARHHHHSHHNHRGSGHSHGNSGVGSQSGEDDAIHHDNATASRESDGDSTPSSSTQSLQPNQALQHPKQATTTAGDEVIDDLPDLSLLDHVKPGKPYLYAVSTGKEMHDTRALAVYSTWCSTLDACAYYSDAPNPKKTPTTITLTVPDADKITDPFRLAQLRYLRILSHSISLIQNNHGRLFTKNRWLIITDDDTYVFHHNMYTYLDALNAQTPMYTGHTLPPDVYPVADDGHGNKLGSAVRTHFACGGGGSVFSLGAVRMLEPFVASCINDTRPGHFMDDWNSDWQIGECAHRAGVPLIDQPADRFGQFVYGDDQASKQPSDPGAKMYCVNTKEHNGRCHQPVSLHPLHEPKAMHHLWSSIPNSTTQLTNDYYFYLQDDGSIKVLEPGHGPDTSNTSSSRP